MSEMVLVLDFGGESHGRLIVRRVRDLGVYCEILPASVDISRIKEKAPKGIILAGAGTIASEVTELGVPIHVAAELAAFEPDCLRTFLYDTCACSNIWQMEDYAERTVQMLREKIGDKKVLCALSGGVDSTVAAVMIHQAVGQQLTCIFVDHGLLRKNEADDVERM